MPTTPQPFLDALPAIFRETPFLGTYLKAFEKVLLGADDGVPLPDAGALVAGRDFPAKGLEETIAGLSAYFTPAAGTGAPDDFLPWLSEWVAFSIRLDMTVAQQRSFIANAVQSYRMRGTAENLRQLLLLFIGGVPDVTLDDTAPHSFTVTIYLPAIDGKDRQAQVDRQLKIANALIEIEKPAHTVYKLVASYPSMRIAKTSHVGVDTILGVAKY